MNGRDRSDISTQQLSALLVGMPTTCTALVLHFFSLKTDLSILLSSRRTLRYTFVAPHRSRIVAGNAGRKKVWFARQNRIGVPV